MPILLYALIVGLMLAPQRTQPHIDTMVCFNVLGYTQGGAFETQLRIAAKSVDIDIFLSRLDSKAGAR